MAVLHAKQRNRLPAAAFGLPALHKYPVNDPPHARNAKARASQQFNKGKLSSSQKAQIDRKADAELKRGR